MTRSQGHVREGGINHAPCCFFDCSKLSCLFLCLGKASVLFSLTNMERARVCDGEAHDTHMRSRLGTPHRSTATKQQHNKPAKKELTTRPPWPTYCYVTPRTLRAAASRCCSRSWRRRSRSFARLRMARTALGVTGRPACIAMRKRHQHQSTQKRRVSSNKHASARVTDGARRHPTGGVDRARTAKTTPAHGTFTRTHCCAHHVREARDEDDACDARLLWSPRACACARARADGR